MSVNAGPVNTSEMGLNPEYGVDLRHNHDIKKFWNYSTPKVVATFPVSKFKIRTTYGDWGSTIQSALFPAVRLVYTGADFVFQTLDNNGQWEPCEIKEEAKLTIMAKLFGMYNEARTQIEGLKSQVEAAEAIFAESQGPCGEQL